ncbi:phage portal protein [Pediococcus claussenii]|uniref:phage portal protein n=1 Tax=Pediococcus claussenii TaxID=187452 RepID=UPI00081A7DB2|nr:phage portal protein [Pediococcus claussenii]ANZ70367.1 portal protein [Pediococcus claussenii]ANZ72183.1 portal protein [Pediococcus claussenii]
MPMFHLFDGQGGNSIGSTEDVINFLTGQSADSPYISAEDSLKNSDIYSAIYQLSGDLASVNYLASKKQVQNMIRNPSATSNTHAFWQAVFAQLLLGGEAFIYRWRNINGSDLRWEYLRPSQVSTFLLDDGSGLFYNVTFDEPAVGVMENIPQSDMLHFRLLSKNGGMTGMSPLISLGNELQIKKSSNKLTLDALAKAIISPGVLKVTHGGLLSAKDKTSRSKSFMTQVNNSDGGPVVIDDLEEYTPLEIKSNVAQLLSQTDWTSKQIAKIYGIPDSYLNGQGDQQSSLDQIKGMYANTLNRYTQSVLSEFNTKTNADIEADIRTAIDPMGDSYASNISTLAKNGTLATNQATWLLQERGYLPDAMPEAKTNTIQPLKGGEEDDKEDSN